MAKSRVSSGEVLGAIGAFYVANGIMPTIRQVAEILGVSTSTAHAKVLALADEGVIVYRRGVSRGMSWPQGGAKK